MSNFKMKQKIVSIVIALGLLGGSTAGAVPSVKIGTAALISPASANTAYGNATLSTNTTGISTPPAEIVELARALSGNVDNIYDFVRNNIDTVWMYGLQKGAVGANQVTDPHCYACRQKKTCPRSSLLAEGHNDQQERTTQPT